MTPSDDQTTAPAQDARGLTLQNLIHAQLRLPTFARENLPRLYRLAGWQAGLWVRRDSWGNTVALLTSVNGQTEGKLDGRDPYYQDPDVRGDIYDLRTRTLLEGNSKLPCTGCWQWSWIGVPQDLWDAGPEAAYERTLSDRTRASKVRAQQKALAAAAALGPCVTLTVDTYPVRARLKDLGFRFEAGGWQVPVTRLDEALEVIGTSRARTEAQTLLAALPRPPEDRP